jgi:hypothetical protein
MGVGMADSRRLDANKNFAGLQFSIGDDAIYERPFRFDELHGAHDRRFFLCDGRMK